tara:strand:+ start:133 stop:552 length:420 start_codon:yes stop_codon:yes gene_type:complete
MATMKDFTNAAVSSTTDTTVTLVRKRVVYDEMLITREEFNKLNKQIESGGYEDEIGFEVTNQLIPEEKLRKGFVDLGNDNYVTSDQWYHFSEMDDFSYDDTEYIAFPGDVTSFTDDAVGFMFTNQPWRGIGERIEEATA